MDEVRKIRFAIPPFLLFGSLLWGMLLAKCPLLSILERCSVDTVIKLLAVGVAASIPIGYLISTVSVLLLRLIAKRYRLATYEARLSEDTLDRIWAHLGLKGKSRFHKSLTPYVATTFDHEIVDKRIHEWLFRRWNSFYVAVNSIVALLVAQGVGFALSIPHTFWWWCPTLVMALLLFRAALTAWQETMGMLAFQALRLVPKAEP